VSGRRRTDPFGKHAPVGDGIKATAKLQELGQSLRLDNITREMLDSGQPQRYIDEFSITGPTSNPRSSARRSSRMRNDEIRQKAADAADRETLFLRAGD
jgi:transaldolase